MRGFQRTKGLSQQREHEGKHADHVGKEAGQNKAGVPPEDSFYFRAQKDLVGINLGVYFLIECIFKSGIAKSSKFSVCIKSCVGHSVPQYISHIYYDIVQCASRLFSENTLSRLMVRTTDLRWEADQHCEDARTDCKQRNHDTDQSYFTFCRFDIALCRIFFHTAHFNFDICTKAFKSSIHSLKRCFRLGMIGFHTFLQYGNSFLKLASVRCVLHAYILSVESFFVKRRSRLTDRCCYVLSAGVLVTSLTSATMVLAAPPPAPGSTEAWLDQVERMFVQSSGYAMTIGFSDDTTTGIFYAPLAQFWVLDGNDVVEIAHVHRSNGTLQFRFPDVVWVVTKEQMSFEPPVANTAPSRLARFHDTLLNQPLITELDGLPVGSVFHPPVLGSATGLIHRPSDIPSHQRAVLWKSYGDAIEITWSDGRKKRIDWRDVAIALGGADE